MTGNMTAETIFLTVFESVLKPRGGEVGVIPPVSLWGNELTRVF